MKRTKSTTVSGQSFADLTMLGSMAVLESLAEENPVHPLGRLVVTENAWQHVRGHIEPALAFHERGRYGCVFPDEAVANNERTEYGWSGTVVSRWTPSDSPWFEVATEFCAGVPFFTKIAVCEGLYSGCPTVESEVRLGDIHIGAYVHLNVPLSDIWELLWRTECGHIESEHPRDDIILSSWDGEVPFCALIRLEEEPRVTQLLAGQLVW